METRCRLCAECFSSQIPILEDLEFCSKIFQLFQIKIYTGDNLPTTVCQICYEMVEKTWDFNDRVQKAQEVLTELFNSITEILTPTESSQTQTVLEVSDPLSAPTDIVDLNYINAKDVIKCDFDLSEDANDLSDSSAKSEYKIKPLRSKTKVRKSYKKRTKPINAITDDLDIEFELKEDGNIVPKIEVAGWDTYPWICFECQLSFSLPDDLKEHYTSTHKSAVRYLCADCPKVYLKYSTFLAHVRIHRMKLRFCCDICYKWFPTVSEQEQHRLEHGDGRPHTCSTCGKQFRMQSALVVHARSHLPAELKNRYQCDLCPKRFGTKPNLMAHKRIHTGIKEFTCDQCGKSFVQKGNLDNHLLTHTAARPFNCNVCGKAFKTLMRLRKHGSVHSGLKPHKCDVCGRQFRERGTLKEHHRIHTGAMPFTCEFCGKCFRFKGVLTTHRRQHTGERPYSCNECQHHFTNWPNYNKHMKRRHGINTSVTCRTRQDIPPTGMPHRNPPGTVLAPPQPVVIPESFVEPQPTFYPVLSLYNIPDELLQQRV